jgi:hypothetical protein
MAVPRWRPLLCLIATCAAARHASAQAQADSQIAQALFDEGRDLMDKHDYTRACPLLERSQKLDPGGGTLLNLALCWEGEGKLARANIAFSDSLSLARRDGRRDREQIASSHLDALAPRLPRLRLFARDSIPSAVVYFDDVIEGAEVLGALTPVDPGHHHVRVTAQGMTPWEWDGTLAEGERREVEVILKVPPPPDPCIASPWLCTPPPAPEPPKRIATASWVFGGVAVLSIVATAVTGGIALAAKGSFDSNCVASRGYCSDPVQGQSDYDLMQGMAWASTISLGVAVVAGIIAVAWPRTAVKTKTGANLVLLRF